MHEYQHASHKFGDNEKHSDTTRKRRSPQRVALIRGDTGIGSGMVDMQSWIFSLLPFYQMAYKNFFKGTGSEWAH